MNVIGTCEFCGSSQKSDENRCEGCGASIAHINEYPSTADVVAQTITPVLNDSRKSRFYLTATAIVFAVLFGIFWQKSKIANSRLMTSGESVTLTSMAGQDGGYYKKAMLSNAFADISLLQVMVHEYEQRHAAYPNSMADLGVNADTMVSKNIHKMSIKNEGVISVSLSERFGNDMHLTLVPKLVMGNMTLEWTCSSNLPSYIIVGSRCEPIVGPGGSYNKKAIFESALLEIFHIKNYVHSYFMTHNTFPTSIEDLELETEDLISRNIREISIESDGVISALLNEGVGKEMKLKLIPELAMGSRIATWNCASNLPSKVLADGPCRAF